MANFIDKAKGIKEASYTQPAQSSDRLELFINTILNDSKYDANKLWLIFPNNSSKRTKAYTTTKNRNDQPLTAVKGFLTKELSFGVNSRFTNAMEIPELETLSKNFQLMQVGLRSLLNWSDDSSQTQLIAPGRTLMTQELSSHVWTGTSRPSFNIEFLLISYLKNEDIRDTVKTLFSTVLPTQDKVSLGDTITKSSIGDTGLVKGINSAIGNIKTLTAPLNYLPYRRKDGWNATGTLTLSIGKWFKADKLVATDVQVSFSKEVVKLANGSFSPLSATVSMSLEPYQIITQNEFENFFLSGA